MTSPSFPAGLLHDVPPSGYCHETMPSPVWSSPVKTLLPDTLMLVHVSHEAVPELVRNEGAAELLISYTTSFGATFWLVIYSRLPAAAMPTILLTPMPA